VCWGFGGVLGKSVDATGLVVSFWRLWIGAALLGAVFLASGRRPSLRLLRLATPGGVLFGTTVSLFFTSIRYTSIANAQIISALSPVLVLPFAAFLFRERVTRVAVVCSALAIGGVVVVSLSDGTGGSRSTTGDLLAGASLVAWAGFFVVTKQARARVGTLEYMSAMTLVAALTVTPVTLLTGQELGAVRGVDWVWLLLLVLVPGALGHGLMTWAHRHVDVSASSIRILGEPVLATVAAAVFLGEAVTAGQAWGIAVVLASLTVISFRAPKTVEETEPGAPL